MSDLTHIGPDGRAVMVDISNKDETARSATAIGGVRMSAEAFKIATSRDTKKGDPIAIAELAGIMAAKKTADLIPLCHPLPLLNVKVSISPRDDGSGLAIEATAKTTGKTGVEMEALTAIAGAALTLYDMLKAVDKSMRIEGIELLEKTGGTSGDFRKPSR